MSQHPVIEVITWVREVFASLTYENITDILTHAPQYYIAWWKKLFHDTPEHVFIETTLVVFIIWLLLIRKTVDPKKMSKKQKLSEKEAAWLIDSWQPEPLVPELTPTQAKLNDMIPTVEAVTGLEMKIRGLKNSVINVSSFDFLGLGTEMSVKNTSKAALEKYGCGSCGPRGFYGSIDQHIFFEEAIASFMGTQEAILYSDGASAVSSTIPAFSKKGDLLIVDEACNEAILTGCNLSRSTVHYFKHNDMQDLLSILKSIAKEDKRLRVDTTQQRRFIVSEGLFRNTGGICNLPELVRLGKEYFYRLIIDESISFGTIGKTGRGVTEHFGVSIYDIDIITLSLDTTLASVGGICIGTRDIVDHQRLSGAGYCYSASAPPFLSAAAVESLKLMERNPQYLISLRENAAKLSQSLQSLEKEGLVMLQLNDQPISPVIHLVLADQTLPKFEAELILMNMQQECLQHGVGVSVNRFAYSHPKSTLRPSIRVNVSALLNDKDIKRIASGISAAAKLVMNGNRMK